jgi:mannose-6-phosphate isomerase-like protein (cupin superfamily)
MRIFNADANAKGWYAGPWNAVSQVAVGYANEGINDPHLHMRITEIYLVARGMSIMRVEQEQVALGPGDMLMIEPGEAHTFLSSSPDYFHFVVHVPALPSEEARTDRQSVPPGRLGLA